MLLLNCVECYDIITLSYDKSRTCECGKSTGRCIFLIDYCMVTGNCRVLEINSGDYMASIFYNDIDNKLTLSLSNVEESKIDKLSEERYDVQDKVLTSKLDEYEKIIRVSEQPSSKVNKIRPFSEFLLKCGNVTNSSEEKLNLAGLCERTLSKLAGDIKLDKDFISQETYDQCIEQIQTKFDQQKQ